MSSPTGAAGSPVTGGERMMTLPNGQRVPVDKFGLPKKGRVPISAVQDGLLASAEAYAQAASRAWTDAGFVASEFAPTVLLGAQGCAPLALEATFIGPDGKTNPIVVNPGDLTAVDYYDAADMAGSSSTGTAGVRFLTVNDGRLQACVRNPTMRKGYISPEEREEAAQTLQRMFAYYGIKSELDRAQASGASTDVKTGLNLLNALSNSTITEEGRKLSASLNPSDSDALQRHLLGQLKANRDLRRFAKSLPNLDLSEDEGKAIGLSGEVKGPAEWNVVQAALKNEGVWRRFLNGEDVPKGTVSKPVIKALTQKLAAMVQLCSQGKFDKAACEGKSVCSIVSVRNAAGEAINMCFPEQLGKELSGAFPKDEAVRQGRWWVEESRRHRASEAREEASLGARLGLGAASAVSGGDDALFSEFMGGKTTSPSSLDGGDDSALRMLFGGMTREDRVEY